ncbi:MAG TPA: DUF2585 family protein [Candidatus Paceibacterota bacterium]
MKYAVFLVIIISIAASVLFMMGRTPFCACGYIQFWSGDIWSNENSQQLSDPYSFTHFLHGIGAYGLLHVVARSFPLSIGTRLIIAVGGEASFEVIENTDIVINRYREETLSLNYYGDSVLNSVSDIIIFALGFLFASRMSRRTSIIVFILTEIALMIWIRDSLMINMIMLIYPIEAIKLWQLRGFGV